jgi:hypothetical protein
MSGTGAHSTSTVTNPQVAETRTSTLEVRLPPPQPQPNPLMSMETWTPFLLFLGAVAAIVGLFAKHIASKITDFKEVHKPVHDAIDKELSEFRINLEHKTSRIEQMERSRIADVERIVKLETNITNIEKGQARIETSIDKMMNAHQSNFEQLAQSIRELRDVRPKN